MLAHIIAFHNKTTCGFKVIIKSLPYIYKKKMMNVEEVREYCISKKGVEETFPFDDVTLVFKVMGKMFALLSLNKGNTINLKCDPERAIALREESEYIIPGFHMNKKHWNTVDYNSNISRDLLIDLIDHSYDLVVLSLTKKLKEELKSL